MLIIAKIVVGLIGVVVVFLGALAILTRIGAIAIARRYPPSGRFAEIDGLRLHFIHTPSPKSADLPPILFLHGASSNLRDLAEALEPAFEGRAELLFVDRPGHGWSQRGGATHDTPDGQAETIAQLMTRLGIEKAILVAHSFGSATAAAFAVDHPERIAGLVFLSAASHPWPGGRTSWYNALAARPLIGRLFVHTLTLPVGLTRIGSAMRCVFSPNAMPTDYGSRAAIPLVLRPAAFRANAIDCVRLYDYVVRTSKRYREIAAPTVVITGNRDTVVFEEIHSLGLARDIPGARLVVVDNLGHKPDWIAPDLVVAAVEAVSGMDADLATAATIVERRLIDDRHEPGACAEPQLGDPELSLPLTQ